MSEFALSHFGPVIDPTSKDETIPPSDPISLEEHDQTVPFEIDEEDTAFLERLEEECSPAPLSVSYTSEGLAVLSTGSHVGVVTLPSGTQVEVTPKRSVTNLLWALQYAFDAPVESIDVETEFSAASTFFDAIAILFLGELRTVLDRGLHREYVRTNSVRDHVTGRIDVQRQLRRSLSAPTDFAIEHDEFTADSVLNRAVLTATRVLIRLVRDTELASSLRVQEQRLRQFVTPSPVSVEAVERIELSRLNDHYETLVDLTRTVLTRDFFEDVSAGSQRSLALFVNMNYIFERIVERAFRAVAKEHGDMVVEGQASIQNIVDGPHAVAMRPDVVVRNTEGVPITVVDAKWKTGSVSSADVYQLTSYILAMETDGALVFPGHRDRGSEQSSVLDEYALRSITISTNAPVFSYDDYVDALESSAHEYLEEVV
jgi:5-methylcytosine-specific restriction enzyme subunit McrC